MIRDRRGMGLAGGFLLMLVFILLAGVLVDVYTLERARDWGFRAAQDAALIGASKGRDWESLSAAGIRLDPETAKTEAEHHVTAAAAAAGLTSYTIDVRVLPDFNGGTVAGYPPVSRASVFGHVDWASPEPAVGVYLEFPVATTFLGILNGNAPVTLHTFAAAGVAQP